MPYTVNLSNGNTLTIVEDGQVDLTSTSVALVGKNFSGYGEYVNENFVRIIEHFANDSGPSSPLTGQLWYDTNSSELKVWNSTSWVSTTKPSILNDNVSTTAHYVTFVEQSSGFPTVKVSANKGIVYTPSTGNFGLGVAQASSKLVVNANSNQNVQLSSPNTNTSVHVHGNTGNGQTILLDAYGGSVGDGNYNTENASSLVLRRSNGSGSAPEAVRVNDVIGTIGAQAHSGVNYVANRAAISFVATENWSQGSNGTKIVFRTTSKGNNSLVTAMSILDNRTVECAGNVTVANDLVVGGTIRAVGDVVAFYTSDRNLKTNVEPIKNALEKILQLNGITFNWNQLAADKDLSVREAGVFAQDVLNALPEAVIKRSNGYLAVNYEKMVPLLVEGIKELVEKINQLEQQIK